MVVGLKEKSVPEDSRKTNNDNNNNNSNNNTNNNQSNDTKTEQKVKIHSDAKTNTPNNNNSTTSTDNSAANNKKTSSAPEPDQCLAPALFKCLVKLLNVKFTDATMSSDAIKIIHREVCLLCVCVCVCVCMCVCVFIIIIIIYYYYISAFRIVYALNYHVFCLFVNI